MSVNIDWVSDVLNRILNQYNKTYFSVVAVIVFTLHEIKQRKLFLGHPVEAVKWKNVNM
jgi:hypothetical protein